MSCAACAATATAARPRVVGAAVGRAGRRLAARQRLVTRGRA